MNTTTGRMPAEWQAQDLLWIGFPHLAEEWSGVIDRAQEIYTIWQQEAEAGMSPTAS